ncbi:hypothetical protein M2171_004376 [Bradyrhizobium japonicum USDA 38]|nr:hypothetical protein [Bradyrhizobium japonicum]MCS3895243.1 hypothetical protein [Bradyrhizobium japonicum USDA 38]MCS3947758.1 hypothetical protein [Bradyrhizobium japonicum]MCW2219411.1 hypothetical protein [Bradyrhizobium japonicum]MCW2344025.1 hypothetical protein [Bradyrhizobium japonicum]
MQPSELGVMVTSYVSKAKLEHLALPQIRSFPGGENAISVEVEVEKDAGPSPGMNWRLLITASENADLDRIQYAARTTTSRLKRRYTLQLFR